MIFVDDSCDIGDYFRAVIAFVRPWSYLKLLSCLFCIEVVPEECTVYEGLNMDWHIPVISPFGRSHDYFLLIWIGLTAHLEDISSITSSI